MPPLLPKLMHSSPDFDFVRWCVVVAAVVCERVVLRVYCGGGDGGGCSSGGGSVCMSVRMRERARASVCV